MANPNSRSRKRVAARRGPPAPQATPSQTPVMPRGGNGVTPRHRVRDALDAHIPVTPATTPVPRATRPRHPDATSELRPTDAVAAALQDGFEGLNARLAGIEDTVMALTQALRVQLGLAEADDELENLRIENAHLNDQLANRDEQLAQIRASVAPAPPRAVQAPAPAPTSTPPPVSEDAQTSTAPVPPAEPSDGDTPPSESAD